MPKGEEPLNVFGQLVENLQVLRAEFERQTARIAELEQQNAELRSENDQLRNDPWSSRVTYDNVVDQIASNEDAAQRDFARKLIEPLLKRTQVNQLRKDIKKRVKELNEADEEAAAGESANREVPAVLQTAEAQEVLERFIISEMISEDLQPLHLSKAEQALVAKAICEQLEINEVWQVFGKLWNIPPESFRAYYNKALEQRKSLKFQERLKDILD